MKYKSIKKAAFLLVVTCYLQSCSSNKKEYEMKMFSLDSGRDIIESEILESISRHDFVKAEQLLIRNDSIARSQELLVRDMDLLSKNHLLNENFRRSSQMDSLLFSMMKRETNFQIELLSIDPETTKDKVKQSKMYSDSIQSFKDLWNRKMN